MKAATSFVVATCALLLASCEQFIVDPVYPPPRERPEPGDAAACDAACANLRAVCPEMAEPTPAGATCEMVCLNVETSGATTLDVACLATAADCDAAHACGYGVAS